MQMGWFCLLGMSIIFTFLWCKWKCAYHCKQCRAWSEGRSPLIWFNTVCKCIVYSFTTLGMVRIWTPLLNVENNEYNAGTHIRYVFEMLNCLFFNHTLWCDHSLELSERDDSNEWSHHWVKLRTERLIAWKRLL